LSYNLVGGRESGSQSALNLGKKVELHKSYPLLSLLLVSNKFYVHSWQPTQQRIFQCLIIHWIQIPLALLQRAEVGVNETGLGGYFQ
jgi:hypothetical protein